MKRSSGTRCSVSSRAENWNYCSMSQRTISSCVRRSVEFHDFRRPCGEAGPPRRRAKTLQEFLPLRRITGIAKGKTGGQRDRLTRKLYEFWLSIRPWICRWIAYLFLKLCSIGVNLTSCVRKRFYRSLFLLPYNPPHQALYGVFPFSFSWDHEVTRNRPIFTLPWWVVASHYPPPGEKGDKFIFRTTFREPTLFPSG